MREVRLTRAFSFCLSLSAGGVEAQGPPEESDALELMSEVGADRKSECEWIQVKCGQPNAIILFYF